MAARNAKSVPPVSEEEAAAQPPHWTEAEVDEGAFKDARLGRRFSEPIRQVGDRMGESIPYACRTGQARRRRIDFSPTSALTNVKF